MDRNEHKSLIDAIRALGDRTPSGELSTPFRQWVDYLVFIAPSIEPPLPHPDPDQTFSPVPALDSLRGVPPSELLECALTHILIASPYILAMFNHPWSAPEISHLMTAYLNLRSSIEHLESVL